MNTLLKPLCFLFEQIAADPIELETQRFAKELGIDTQKFCDEHVMVEDAPFDAKTKLSANLERQKRWLLQYIRWRA